MGLARGGAWQRAPFSPISSWRRAAASVSHMSDHRMALLPFSTLATYVPEGDQDTELMAELGNGRDSVM